MLILSPAVSPYRVKLKVPSILMAASCACFDEADILIEIIASTSADCYRLERSSLIGCAGVTTTPTVLNRRVAVTSAIRWAQSGFEGWLLPFGFMTSWLRPASLLFRLGGVPQEQHSFVRIRQWPWLRFSTRTAMVASASPKTANC